MSGKEIKDYILEKDDIYYNIVIVDINNNRISFDDIVDDNEYEFIKQEQLTIGCGMVLAYYQLK
jgi:hypothetical protein